MDRYKNREHAGQILAKALQAYANQQDVIVLALPRGGVPVGFQIAEALKAPLDVLIVRKLGLPGYGELAMGALAMGGLVVFNPDIVSGYSISDQEVKDVMDREQRELTRREQVYRGNRPFPDIKDKIVILVDDGIATGATMRAAIKSIHEFKPARLIVAVPVADKAVVNNLKPTVDEFICTMTPESLYAVGAWYEDFSQTEDEEVYTLLKLANKDVAHD
jgi:putative phosphoribosyl transferase